MKSLLPLCLSATLALTASTALASIVVNESFSSYADSAAMLGKWSGNAATALDPAFGNPGQSARHAGGAVNTWAGSSFSIKPDALTHINFRADIYDSTIGSAQRNTVGLRNGANPLFEMGHYNSAGSMYAVRLVSMYGAPNWVFFPGVTREEGWHRYAATFTDLDVTITLDLGSDGTIDSTLNFAGLPSGNPFVDLRFGGPSGLSSAGAAWFDNIYLETIRVPEPSSLALCLPILGSVGWYAWRARRRA